ncbi:hypothetical protein JOE57_003664 [Microlunatus panaciterrae]|uniref:Uncharacterized protein n=1 Tax=Microlunatus panaciterrae TaxID=400768 RepID=A0ABS2RP12_9ACTN|nr:hypothetical protein [Microlunatus panaciterrae]
MLDEPGLREAVTTLSTEARRVSADGAIFVSCRRVRGGSLLVAKRPVGTDGAGRPENYAVHALFDPSGTLGALDLGPLVRGGAFVLDRCVDAAPDPAAELVEIKAPDQWDESVSRVEAPGSVTPAPGSRFACWDLAEADAILGRACREFPADLVNRCEVDGAVTPAQAMRRPEVPVVPQLAIFDEAVALGAVLEDLWWERRGWTEDQWRAVLEQYMIVTQPVGSVPDASLTTRWDRSDVRGRAAVALELLVRPTLSSDSVVRRDVAARPQLVDEIVELGVTGSPSKRSAAARWVAAAGTPEQVLDLATELSVQWPGDRLPAVLEEHLRQQSPADLPQVLLGPVAASLDATEPLSPEWRAICLELLFAGQRTCKNSAALGEASSDAELAAAVVAADEQGAALSESWHRLASISSPERRERVFAQASAATATYLLGRWFSSDGAALQRDARRRLAAAWPRMVSLLDWPEGIRGAMLEVTHQQRMLRLQRMFLLLAVGVLGVAVVVLAVIMIVRP